jgi:hypothetical protein
MRLFSVIVGQKAMTENQGNNIGCFKRDDFINILLMLPNQHWTIDQAEQALYVLVNEGGLQEIEPWRYKPNSP